MSGRIRSRIDSSLNPEASESSISDSKDKIPQFRFGTVGKTLRWVYVVLRGTLATGAKSNVIRGGGGGGGSGVGF